MVVVGETMKQLDANEELKSDCLVVDGGGGRTSGLWEWHNGYTVSANTGNEKWKAR
jgi:hypothetical protein